MEKNKIGDRLFLEEYEIQHYGFSSSYFLTEFQNAINHIIKSIHEQMEKSIARNLELCDVEKQILRVEIEMLTESYMKETNKCLREHEDEIRNIFHIPQHVLSPSDKIHEEYKDIDLQQLSEEIDQLKREYLKEKSLSFLYQNEINHINQTVKLQEQISKLLEQIEKMPSTDDSARQFYKLYNLHKDVIQRFENEYEVNLERHQRELNYIE